MRDEHDAVEQRFYQRCAELLGTTYTYVPWPSPTRGPNRWNNRHAGNGRYPGFGMIRMHAKDHIHVVLRAPKPISRVCKTQDEVFAILTSLSDRA